MTSEFESFGLSALEAMACEVPVISSNTGGLPELIQDNISGFLHDVGDIENMSRSAIELLSDEDMLKTFKKNALKRAHDFEISKIVQQYLEVYESVI